MFVFMFLSHICLAIYDNNIQPDIQSGSCISLSAAADGTVQLLEAPSSLVTYINPSSLTGLSAFNVQVEKMFTISTCALKLPHSKLRGVCEFLCA